MTEPLRLVFFGTPAFSVPTLDALEASGRRPVLVVSQPARRSGRGRQMAQPPVAEWALERGVPLAQPEKVRTRSFREEIEALRPDVAVVVAFGQIFSQPLLDVPPHGCINVHASLLPRHRGAAPIAASILAGDAVTGVTTMVMERGLDSGPMLLKAETEIGARETCGELTERLAVLGGNLLVDTLDALERGELEPEEQDHSSATFAPRLEKAQGALDFSQTATQVDRQQRAFDPWPGSHADLGGQRIRVLAGLPLQREEPGAAPGALLGLEDGRLVVACGAGTFYGLEQVQKPGRQPVAARDFANGLRDLEDLRFEVPQLASQGPDAS